MNKEYKRSVILKEYHEYLQTGINYQKYTIDEANLRFECATNDLGYIEKFIAKQGWDIFSVPEDDEIDFPTEFVPYEFHLAQAFERARGLVGKFDRQGININNLSLYDLGSGTHGGFIASFDFDDVLHGLENGELDRAGELPRTARGASISEAIDRAVEKCEAELATRAADRRTTMFERLAIKYGTSKNVVAAAHAALSGGVGNYELERAFPGGCSFRNAIHFYIEKHRRPLREFECCALANIVNCVCYASYECIVHGRTHIGTHD